MLLADLKNLLTDCFGKESATQSLAQTLTKWIDDSLKRARLAKFQRDLEATQKGKYARSEIPPDFQ